MVSQGVDGVARGMGVGVVDVRVVVDADEAGGLLQGRGQSDWRRGLG